MKALKELKEVMRQDEVLKPGDVEPGLAVVIYSTTDPGAEKLARFPYTVKALQGPFAVLEGLTRPDFKVLIDLRRSVLMELSPEMRSALEETSA